MLNQWTSSVCRHSCIKSKVTFLQIVGLFIYFLNMYNLFDIKSCIAELHTGKRRQGVTGAIFGHNFFLL